MIDHRAIDFVVALEILLGLAVGSVGVLEIHFERLLHPRQLFFGADDGQLVDPLFQLQVVDRFVDLLVVELEQHFALVDLGAELDHVDDFEFGPGLGAQGHFFHLAGDERAVERDVDFQPLGFDLVGLPLLVFGLGRFVVGLGGDFLFLVGVGRFLLLVFYVGFSVFAFDLEASDLSASFAVALPSSADAFSVLDAVSAGVGSSPAIANVRSPIATTNASAGRSK